MTNSDIVKFTGEITDPILAHLKKYTSEELIKHKIPKIDENNIRVYINGCYVKHDDIIIKIKPKKINNDNFRYILNINDDEIVDHIIENDKYLLLNNVVDLSFITSDKLLRYFFKNNGERLYGMYNLSFDTFRNNDEYYKLYLEKNNNIGNMCKIQFETFPIELVQYTFDNVDFTSSTTTRIHKNVRKLYRIYEYNGPIRNIIVNKFEYILKTKMYYFKHINMKNIDNDEIKNYKNKIILDKINELIKQIEF